MRRKMWLAGIVVAIPVFFAMYAASADEKAPAPTSYSPVVITEPFEQVVARMEAAKAAIQQRQADLLQERYDLSDKPAAGGNFPEAVRTMICAASRCKRACG